MRHNLESHKQEASIVPDTIGLQKGLSRRERLVDFLVNVSIFIHRMECSDETHENQIPSE